MFAKWLEHGRQVMFLGLGLFFFASSGLMAKWIWTDDPIRFLGNRLLHDDGKLLVSIVSHPKTVATLKELMKPEPDVKRESVAKYVVERLLERDGKLVQGLASHLLKEPTVKALVTDLAKPSPIPKNSDSSKGSGIQMQKLVRYVVDRLLAKRGEALQAMTSHLLRQPTVKELVERFATPRPAAPPKKNASAAWLPLAKYTVNRLLERDAKLLVGISKQVIPKEVFATSRPVSPQAQKEQSAAMERLGKYAVDRLLEARARPLRAMLQDLVGPEAMRLVREARQLIQNVGGQLKQVQVEALLRGVAYETGKGALEGFFQNQAKKEASKGRQSRKVERESKVLQREMAQKFPCVKPVSARWIRWDKGVLRVKVSMNRGRAQCAKVDPSRVAKSLWSWLKEQRRLGLHPDDIQIQWGHSTKKATSSKALKGQEKRLKLPAGIPEPPLFRVVVPPVERK